MKNSLYIHIPFCKQICPYCDFHKTVSSYETRKKYLEAIKKEAVLKNIINLSLDTIYIGGGTPSSLEYDLLEDLLSFINNSFDLNNLLEFTIEANIDDINERFLNLISLYHVNRLSIGIQTISKNGQDLLKRYALKDEIIQKINLVKKYFNNYNLDLMYGYPNETYEELDDDLSFIKEINPPHVSIYCLIKEDHTIFGIKDIKELDETVQEKMYFKIADFLENNNYIHYETSNYAKEGFEAIHNLVYFNDEEYYSLGSGASSFIENIHARTIPNVVKYIDAINQNIIKEEKEILSKEDVYDEFVLMNLRKIKGIDFLSFYNRFNINFKDIYPIDTVKLDSLFEINDNSINIRKEKLFISNYCIVEILKLRK